MQQLINLGILAAVAVFVVLPLLGSSVRVVQEYERGVIFRLGRLVGPRGPGLFLILPFVDRMVKIDLRVVTMEVPPQEVITRDNVTMRVSAVLYFRVVDPGLAVTGVADYVRASFQIAQTTLRSVLGESELDELLANRDRINAKLQEIIDTQTEPWGVKVSTVEVKDVELPESMQRATRSARSRFGWLRAKIIHASGEFEAAQTLADAARVIGSEPQTLQLRYLQTLTEIAAERNSTIIFPVPIDLIAALLDRAPSAVDGHRPAEPTPPREPAPTA